MANSKPAPDQSVGLGMSRYDAAKLSGGWVADIGLRAAVLLEDDPARPSADYLHRAVKFAAMTGRAIEAGSAAGAAMAAAGTMQAAWQVEMIEARERWFEPKVAPKVAIGQKFTAGRKVGTIGLVRLAVRRILKREPSATAARVWEAITAKPPKGITPYDNRLGKYIEAPGQAPTGYRRFANIVSEEKRPK